MLFPSAWPYRASRHERMQYKSQLIHLAANGGVNGIPSYHLHVGYRDVRCILGTRTGFSSDRLKRVTDAFQSEVDKGAIPGAVVLIARNGKIAYFEAFGFQNRENKEPMKTDAIFRIASMSKPITSVAVMMLVEEGKIQLLDPVSRYLPEFKGVQVGLEKLNTTTGNSELIGEPPRQEMTIQDLLRHTSGITYGIFGKSLVKQAYNEANLFDRNQTLAEFVSKIAKLPLAYHPGTTAVAGGGLVLAAILVGAIRSDLAPMAAAVASLLGGIVVWGSNTSTAKEAANEITAAESKRAGLIEQINPRVIS
jgi:CubicO group peptidase (beta-lactamase class C family)